MRILKQLFIRPFNNEKKVFKSSAQTISEQSKNRQIHGINLKPKFFINPLLLFGGLTTIFQLLSSGIIFNDPKTGSSTLIQPSEQDIYVPDKDATFHFHASAGYPSQAINELNVVVFGVNISWENACLGSQIIANQRESPVLLVHNGSVNPLIDYIRAGLNRLHFWPFGLGHDVPIRTLERTLHSILSQENHPKLKLIGHSAGASTIYSAVKALIKDHPELKEEIQNSLSLEFWGSPEFIKDMQDLENNCEVTIFNRKNDYIVNAFQSRIWGGLALPVAAFKVLATLNETGNQHRAILYLRDYESALNS
ncbi:MAG: hypothetical protein SFU25_08745 [Candidatus Caenarcaniphilales bacterium]|nr:hypothetical protein [Candidatus Caenarcaniphilales bacterium]